jgi:hypothetical protein
MSAAGEKIGMVSSANRHSIWRKYRILVICFALVVLACFWWLFRPERLFTNTRVNEAAPTGIAALQPVFTGELRAIGGAATTHGRVNIFKDGSSLQLQISNLESKPVSSFTVALAGEADSTSGATSLGSVTVSGNEKLAIPTGLDPGSRKTVLLMDASHQVVAKTALEPF